MSAARVMVQAGPGPHQGKGRVWEGVLPVGWGGHGCFTEEACRLVPADRERQMEGLQAAPKPSTGQSHPSLQSLCLGPPAQGYWSCEPNLLP